MKCSAKLNGCFTGFVSDLKQKFARKRARRKKFGDKSLHDLSSSDSESDDEL